jgi:hypothetical protein
LGQADSPQVSSALQKLKALSDATVHAPGFFQAPDNDTADQT